jgi:hypothetical protein
MRAQDTHTGSTKLAHNNLDSHPILPPRDFIAAA